MDIRGMDEPMSLEKAARKTERSHEENQERAYIAASRRADRSIEARVQSARMASEIHKKRTGKGFKITEDIVLKEEMYEEEDDDLPRSYRLLSASMQTSSPEMNSRLDAYLSNKMAMSQMLARTNDEWRENEINRLFAASFPNAIPSSTQQLSQNTPSQSPYQQPLSEPYSPSACSTAAFSPTSYSPPPFAQSTQTQMAMQPQHSPMLNSFAWQSRSKTPRRKSRPSISGVKSRRNSSKSSAGPARKKSVESPSTTTTRSTPFSSSAISPLTPDEPLFPCSSAFTAELPPEARMMLDGVGADDVLDRTLAGQEGGNNPNWLDPCNFLDTMALHRFDSMAGVDDGFVADLYGNGAEDSMPSKCAMPNTQNSMDGGLDWRSFINDSMWANDQ